MCLAQTSPRNIVLFSLLEVSPWFAFNQSYFQYVRTGYFHSEARASCKERKGALATISSEEEQTFLYETFIQPDPEGKRELL